MNQLGELGRVSHIIAPNLYHYLFAADCKTLYSNAILWAAQGLETKKPDLPIDQIRGFKKLSPSLLEQVATAEKEKVKESVEKVLAWDFERVIMAHGSIIEYGGKQKFKEGYEQFLGRSLY